MIEEDTEGQILVSIHVHTYKHLHITYKHRERQRDRDITHTLGEMGQADQHTLVQAGLELCVLLRVTLSF